jgi:hypothetical protein
MELGKFGVTHVSCMVLSHQAVLQLGDINIQPCLA